MDIQREYGKLVAIVCGYCSDEFHPEWDNQEDAEGETSLSIAIAQAETVGWEREGDMMVCPQCAKEQS